MGLLVRMKNDKLQELHSLYLISCSIPRAAYMHSRFKSRSILETKQSRVLLDLNWITQCRSKWIPSEIVICILPQQMRSALSHPPYPNYLAQILFQNILKKWSSSIKTNGVDFNQLMISVETELQFVLMDSTIVNGSALQIWTTATCLIGRRSHDKRKYHRYPTQMALYVRGWLCPSVH